MPKGLFEAPGWDNDVPIEKFNFNKKAVKLGDKTKKQIAPTKKQQHQKAIKNNNDVKEEPGKYVRINNKNTNAINVINGNPLKNKKRKINQHDREDGVGGGGARKKMKKTNGTSSHDDGGGDDDEQSLPSSSLIKKRKFVNQNDFSNDNDDNISLGNNNKKGLRKNKKLDNKNRAEGGGGGGDGTGKGKRSSYSNSSDDDDDGGNDAISTSTKKTKKDVIKRKADISSSSSGHGDHNKEAILPTISFKDKLIGNLKGSRFRFINEMLYTNDGANAVKIFKEDPEAFEAYHDGYKQQVQQWPMNPLDRMIKTIKKLPKDYVVADFGCGEGRLARSIPQKTYSLDLVAKRDDIIAGDMAKTPLETNSINVAVYCLSLMGTNLKDFFCEANRVLKIGGQLKIAEVESRFQDVRQFIENVKRCGFELVNQDLSNNLFLFINFKKSKTIDKTLSKKIEIFSLKPCLYKKR